MDNTDVIRRIEEALRRGTETLASQKTNVTRGGVTAWIDPALLGGFRAAGIALLADVYGRTDQRYEDFLNYTSSNLHPGNVAKAVPILNVLRQEVDNGWLASTRGLVAADVFADRLEMAAHLVEEGYKDAAAVIAGSSLEAHLKRLCTAAGIALEVTNAKGDLVPRKADTLNAERASASVYNRTEQKQVTAWLGVRNDAAHGEYAKVLADLVKTMIVGIRDFYGPPSGLIGCQFNTARIRSQQTPEGQSPQWPETYVRDKRSGPRFFVSSAMR